MLRVAKFMGYEKSMGRDMAVARKAHEAEDVEASKEWHDGTSHELLEKHSAVGGRLKSIIYGGLDGIITTFAVVAGAVGGGLSTEVILILGFSSVFADALSMGVGDTLSTKAENEFIMSERRREEWEMENHPKGEIEEMVELYVKRGMELADARLVIETMAKYRDFFVDVMMTEELGLQVPDPDDNPIYDGMVTGCSFVFHGTVPLLGYVAFYSMGLNPQELFLIAILLTACTLFTLGVLKTKFTTQKWYAGGCEILVMGSFTAAVAYGVGWFIEAVVLSGRSAVGGLH